MGKRQIKHLLAKRESFKCQLRTFCQFVGNLNSEITNVIKFRLERIKIVYSEFSEIQTELEIAMDHSDDELDERMQFETEYFDIISEAQTILDMRGNESPVNNAPPTISQPFSLPKINLPTFSGEYNDFLHFFLKFTMLSFIKTAV